MLDLIAAMRLIIANDVLIKNMRHRDARWHDDPDVLKVLQANTEFIKQSSEQPVDRSAVIVQAEDLDKAIYAVQEAGVEFKVLGRYPARESVGWQPIETAPKDGTRFIAYGTFGDWNDPHRNEMKNICHYRDGALRDGIPWRTQEGDAFKYTHWMPLPKSPTGIEDGATHENS